MSDKYAEAGVNVSAGDAFSAFAGDLCKTTFNNCQFVEFHDLSKNKGGASFRSPKPFSITEGRGFYQDAAPDGVGTKVGLYDAARKNHLAAHDLVAMTAGDITRQGGLPASIVNILSVRSLGEPGSPLFMVFQAMMRELVAVGNRLNMVVHKGETAEKGAFVGTDNPHARAPFDWEAVVTGICHPHKIIYGDRVQAGDVVIALKENGFRSNGISLVRKAFQKHYGADYQINGSAQSDLDKATEPSVLYDPLLTTAHGWYENGLQPLFDLRLIAHLTGGGIEKFVELLRPTGLSANLFDLYEPPDIMARCGEWMDVSQHEFYRTWNGGQGMLVVVPHHEGVDFMNFAGTYGIDAKVCGLIRESETTSVTINSKYKRGGELTYN